MPPPAQLQAEQRVTPRGGSTWTLLAVMLLALAWRLPSLERPLVGHFATKNVVYAMIARNWASGVAPIAYPTLDCQAGGQRAWHLTEFPVMAYAAGSAWTWGSPWLGGSLDAWGRATSIACSLASVWAIWWLVRRWHSTQAATVAALVLALSPVSAIYGQAFMLESSVVLLTLMCWIGCERFVDPAASRRSRKLALAGMTLAAALLALTKIFMLVIWPVLWWRIVRAGTLNKAPSEPLWARSLVAAVALSVAAAPAMIWYGHIYRATAPGGVAAERSFYSIRDSAAVHAMPHPLLADAAFYQHILADLAGPVLTPLGLVLACLAFCHPHWRRHGPWLASMAALVLLLPLKFFKMQYYGLVVLPPLAVLVGLGWEHTCRHCTTSRWRVALLVAVAVAASLRYTIGPAWTIADEDRSVLPAAAAFEQLAGRDDLVATTHGSTIDLLYYCQRPGWAIAADDPCYVDRLTAAQRAGARWLVVAHQAGLSNNNAAYLAGALTPAAAGHDWCIYRLPELATQATDTADRRDTPDVASHATPAAPGTR